MFIFDFIVYIKSALNQKITWAIVPLRYQWLSLESIRIISWWLISYCGSNILHFEWRIEFIRLYISIMRAIDKLNRLSWRKPCWQFNIIYNEKYVKIDDFLLYIYIKNCMMWLSFVILSDMNSMFVHSLIERPLYNAWNYETSDNWHCSWNFRIIFRNLISEEIFINLTLFLYELSSVNILNLIVKFTEWFPWKKSPFLPFGMITVFIIEIIFKEALKSISFKLNLIFKSKKKISICHIQNCTFFYMISIEKKFSLKQTSMQINFVSGN